MPGPPFSEPDPATAAVSLPPAPADPGADGPTEETSGGSVIDPDPSRVDPAVRIALASGFGGPVGVFGAPLLVPQDARPHARPDVRQVPMSAAPLEAMPPLEPPTTLIAVAGTAGAGPPPRGDITHDQVIDLYAEHHDSLVRFASLVAPENGMAEDLVQEAFVRLYKSWGNIRDRDKVPAYLRSTIANLARGRGRRLVVASRHRPAPSPDAASAEEGVLRLENQSEVVTMLRRLPTRQRECLVLRYYEGQTESEIAATLGISIGSVRTHTTRGMAALQRHFGVAS